MKKQHALTTLVNIVLVLLLTTSSAGGTELRVSLVCRSGVDRWYHQRTSTAVTATFAGGPSGWALTDTKESNITTQNVVQAAEWAGGSNVRFSRRIWGDGDNCPSIKKGLERAHIAVTLPEHRNRPGVSTGHVEIVLDDVLMGGLWAVSLNSPDYANESVAYTKK